MFCMASEKLRHVFTESGLCDRKEVAEKEKTRENPWEEVGSPVYLSVLHFPSWRKRTRQGLYLKSCDQHMKVRTVLPLPASYIIKPNLLVTPQSVVGKSSDELEFRRLKFRNETRSDGG